MEEFVLLFRQPSYDYSDMTPNEMQALTKKWQDWIGDIVNQDKLASHGIRLGSEGKSVKSAGIVTDGPFVEIKERLGGFIVVKAANIDEATTLAHGCPAIDAGGSVEIRSVFK